MALPVISVVMPFRNSAEWIARALDSLLRQSFSHFEVLMIDHGSSDSSREIAAEYTADSRFRLLDGNGSFVEALNYGLREASGQWIARMDSDDICHPERLALQYEAASRFGRRFIITSRVRCFPDYLVTAGFRRYEQWINSTVEPEEIERSLFVESPVPHPTGFFHRESVLQQGGYMDIPLPEDYELWLRLWSRGFSFYRVPKVLLGWREHRERLSRTSCRYSLTAFYRTRAMYLAHVPALKGRDVFIAGAGQCARRLSAELLKQRFTIRGFISPVPVESGRKLKGINVIEASKWHSDCGVPVLVASRKQGARERICTYLDSRGLENWKDYVICS
ncbi:glycosyl transferase [Candidatus Fermentibacteria bacterium]|nr:MAG: glycosyl transferase [Candidatus Fermentibacteria bacterium]